MRKKLLSMLLCATMVTTMFVGCGGDPEPTKAPASKAETEAEKTTKESESTKAETKESKDEKTTEEKTTEEKTTEEKTTKGSDSESKETPVADGELVYWSMWDAGSKQANAIQEAIDAYTDETGVKVHVEWKGRDISKVIQAALEAGTNIDLFDEDYERIGKQYAKDCLDLEDMAKKAEYDSFAIKVLPQTMREWAGSLKGIAYQPYTSGIFYNKAIFKEAGIEKEPETWAEFLEVCQKIKDAGYAPLALDDAYVLYNYGFQLARYIGEDAVEKLCSEGGWKDSKEALQAAQDMVDLVDKGYLNEDAPGAYPANENTIGYDETAMIVNASWVPNEITTQTQCDLEWGMFNYPTVEGGKDPSTIANVGSQAFAIPAKSKNAQAAFDLIMKITSGEFDQKIALATDSIPADTRNTEWSPLVEGCKEEFNGLTDIYAWNMGLNKDPDLQKIIESNILKLFEGQLNAQGFIDAVDAASKK